MENVAAHPDYQKAISAFNARLFEDAIRYCKSVLSHSPTSYDALHLMGIVYFKLEKVEQAQNYLEKAVEQDNLKSQTHLSLGVVLSHRGELDKAITHYEKAIELEPQNLQYYADCIDFLMKNGFYKKAKTIIDASLAINGKQLQHKIALAQVMSVIEPESAEAHFLSCIQEFPQEIYTYWSLAIFYASVKDYEKAMTVCEQALKIHPNQLDMMMLVGHIKAWCGDKAAAESQYNSVIKLYPESLGAYNWFQKIPELAPSKE